MMVLLWCPLNYTEPLEFGEEEGQDQNLCIIYIYICQTYIYIYIHNMITIQLYANYLESQCISENGTRSCPMTSQVLEVGCRWLQV